MIAARNFFIVVKRDQPRFSVYQAIEEAHRSGAVTETPSVHRLLNREGLMTRPPSTIHDHRRFQMRWAGALCQLLSKGRLLLSGK